MSAKSGRATGRRRLTRVEAQALTRRRLLEAAADIFAEKGFRAASLADVADRAGYTIGAVYSNFASKNEMFQELMAERLRMAEASLGSAFSDDAQGGRTPAISIDEQIEQELDGLERAEQAVPERWWRLLYEYRAHVGSDAAARAELADVERRCREIVAGHIERFAIAAGLILPMSPIVLAELSAALTDGLRVAHAEGRSSLTPGAGLRGFVRAILESSDRVESA